MARHYVYSQNTISSFEYVDLWPTIYLPYARRYNPQFVYFLKSKNVFSRGFFLKILALMYG